MTTTTTRPAGVIHNMPDHEYHARPELSSTQARQILDSPAKYQWKRTHQETSAAFDVGTAVHTKILGTGSVAVPYPVEHLTATGNVSTKAATVTWAAEQRAAGLVPIAPADMRRVNAMTEAVLAHPTARHILEQPGHREASAFATDPDTGVNCRARFDFLPNLDIADPIAADVKTTAGSASPTGFGTSAAKFDYPIQEAWYTDTLAWITGAEPVRFAFVVVEKAAPHLVAVHEFDELVRQAGREFATKARHIYAECVATGNWPGYGDDLITTDIPNWWINRADNNDDEMSI